MRNNITLPLGIFQIHLNIGGASEASLLLQEALEKHQELLDRTGNLLNSAEAIQEFGKEFEESAKKINESSEKFQRALDKSECPEVLPEITRDLIFASMASQIFSLSFQVEDYELTNDKERLSWWVEGCVTNKYGEKYQGAGTSFSFDKHNDEIREGRISEGALLSACADAAFPYFPWRRSYE